MELPFEIPEGLGLETDVSPADWVDEHLLPFRGSGDRVLVGEMVPIGFEAYARILHPARRRSGDRHEPLTWAELARDRGKRVHPEVQLPGLLGEDFREGTPWGELPEEGSIPGELLFPLIEILERHSTTPNRCLFCIWDGFGFWGGGGVGKTLLAMSGRRGRVQRRQVRREARGRARREQAMLSRIPRVQIHPSPDRRGAFREYFLFRGALGALTAFRHWSGHGFQSPNIWWPEDRAWVVATEIDDWSTYVGGTRSCVEDLLASEDLEVVPSDPGFRWDIRGDRVNAPDAS